MMAAEDESASECILKRKSGKTIMVTGLAGAGKSTLVNRVFELTAQEEATKTVRCYCHKLKNGVEATVFDTPGFDDPEINEHRIIADMKLISEQKLDFLLYCVSVASSGARVTQEDVGAFQLLTNVFGVSLWKNATFVITYANVACERLQKDQYFQLLENVKKNLYTYLHDKAYIPMDIVSQIPLLTAGDTDPVLPYEKQEWAQRFTEKVRRQSACQYVMQQDLRIVPHDTVGIKVVTCNTQEFAVVSEKFQQAWAKGSCPPVCFVFIINNRQLQQRWSVHQQKLSDQTVEEHYHGTQLLCDITTSNTMCNDKDCGICGISRTGFSWWKSHSKQFGNRFYLAPNSSKCHDYTQGAHGYRAMLLCDVCQRKKNVGEEKLKKCSAGSIFNYDEIVDESILPRHIIIYQWKP